LRRDTWPELVRLGWPISTTLLVRITMRTVDILVVGIAVGAAGVAAIGVGDAIARLVLFTGLGLGAGAIATVAQALGAGDQARADLAATHAALLAIVVGVPFAVAGWFGAAPLYDLLGADGEVASIGADYLRIVLLSAPARVLAIVLTRAFQGAADSRTPLYVRSTGTGINIVLTILLVPGLLGLPELGVAGAAVATAIGNVFSAVVLGVFLVRGWRGLSVTPGVLRDLRPAVGILRIAAPQVLERNLFALGSLPLNAITLSIGTAANAGLQVGQRVMLYGLLPARGAATAASSIAGNRLGAGDPDRAERVIRGGLSLSAVIAAPVIVALLVLAEQLAGLFVGEPDALAAATGWVRVYAVALLARSLYGVFRGAFQASGDNRPPLLTSAVGITVFAVGLSWLLGIQLGLGLVGVYVGVLLDPLVRTVWLWRWFERGTWRRTIDLGGDGSAAAGDAGATPGDSESDGAPPGPDRGGPGAPDGGATSAPSTRVGA
jgi:putative MATE family efflux protein